jgi:hypothetical protein
MFDGTSQILDSDFSCVPGKVGAPSRMRGAAR